jgi:VIT1/CCC1 family predicted Fe2+/Mn2+ transporter
MKLTQPYDKLKARMGWVNDFSPSIVKAIGAVELLGALGLVLPSVTGILPWLTPLAAAGLVLDMLGAITTHIRRHEVMPYVAANLVLLILAAVVAYGRFAIVPL